MKKGLLDSDSEDSQPTLKVNEEFAKRFEHNKRRELLDKAKEKYGKDLEGAEEEESSSSSEDESAELLNP